MKNFKTFSNELRLSEFIGPGAGGGGIFKTRTPKKISSFRQASINKINNNFTNIIIPFGEFIENLAVSGRVNAMDKEKPKVKKLMDKARKDYKKLTDNIFNLIQKVETLDF